MAARKKASPAVGAKGRVDAGDALIDTLKRRFAEHPNRHPGLPAAQLQGVQRPVLLHGEGRALGARAAALEGIAHGA